MSKTYLLNISLLLLSLGLSAGNTQAQTASTTELGVPKILQAPADQGFMFKASAKGSQIYICRAKSNNSNSFEWTLKAPDALLFNEQEQRLGKHYAGPTWESNDGSKIMAQVYSKVNAPQTTAIPWLLLKVQSRQGNGVFSQVNWIQRLHTVGGKPPVLGCNRTYNNRETKVSYEADYYFWGVSDKKDVKR
jgi:Protein of unknown function (DUF3455)